MLGSTGAGKSTLMHLLAGKKLLGQDAGEEWGQIDLIAAERLPNISIARGCAAGTLIPSPVFDFEHHVALIDFPGFHDPRGKDQELINAKILQKTLTGKLRIILVVPEGEIIHRQGVEFISLMDKISAIFPDPEKIKFAITIVVSRPAYW